jgi:4-diphosphocytidyl-2-C-methyl-D-erythritol kinase
VYPEVRQAIDWLSRFADAKLTGTGACVFAAFSDENEARAVLKQASALSEEKVWTCFVAKGINESPVSALLTSSD